ncbi:hypothetical protein [Paenibacillus sp. OV219]|uniref:hypothetical protein n=1 Tax=Paenibacillus sp. OV219 TaxID=1884377 RepID=UPI0008D84EFB|nr:hypothetical protein [Paenibacillus sp. OV219]SEO06115.1 hypothetical protein SAMN05518847_105384 [Paenibacillus sp. OV219]
MNKRITLFMLTFALILTLLPVSVAQADAKADLQKNVALIISAFAKQSGFTAADVDSIITDLNNDNSREVVVWIKHPMDSNTDFYLGVYSLGTTKKLQFEKLYSSDYIYDSYVTVRTIKNPRYKTSLAVVSFGNSYIDAEVYTTKYGVFKRVGSAYMSYSMPNGVYMKDINGDGYEEFVGLNNEYDLGNEQLSNAEYPVGKVIYKWNVNKLTYVASQYGSDGKLDSTRKPVGSLTSAQALAMLKKAYTMQIGMSGYYEFDTVRAKMKPSFSNNIVSGFIRNGLKYDYGFGYKPIYQTNEDNVWLLPKFTNAPVQFNISTDKNRIKIVQKQKKEYSGGSYDRNATAVLVKTKYGWKIDNYGYNF